MEERDIGYDFIRMFAICIVFMGHIIGRQIHSEPILLIIRSLSPGLTMSLLGFISGYLLVAKYDLFDGNFYIKRFSRIYSSLIICLLPIILFHIYLSYDVLNQHSVLHLMGLSFFMDLLHVPNKSSIGAGLWFITIINFMYLSLPLIKKVYSHEHSKIHLFLIIIFCLFFQTILWGSGSGWNVIISFNIGCYVAQNSNIKSLSKRSLMFYIVTTAILLLVCGLSTSKAISYEMRILLLPLYPFFAVPLLYKIGNRVAGKLRTIV